ncbi:MAG TPA: HD-GYP domain-containing protein [Candidatus Dormibacteraeota bacterium]|nr:HD-GYP domain-containing protein [Candidatus Dormibacteraeota bacterium]
MQRAEAMDVAAIGQPQARPAQRPQWRAFERLRAAFAEDIVRAAPVTYTPELVAYVGLTNLVAIGVGVATVRTSTDPAGTAILASAIALMAVFNIRFLSTVNTLFSATTFMHLGLALGVGPVGALAGAVSESVAVLFRYRTGLFRTAFNVPLVFLANVSAWGTYVVFARLPVHGALYAGLTGIATGFVHWAVNYFMLSGIVTVAAHRPYWRQIREALVVAPYHLCYGYAAIGFVALHDHFGAMGFTFAMAPVAALQAFLVVLSRRTRQHETERDQLLGQLQEESIRVERSYDATLIALTHALDARDKETEGHSRRVVEYTKLIAVQLGIEGEKLKLLCHGALLHDIGKIGVPDAILHKPGPLTEAEWQVMRRHPEIGALMVEEVEYLAEARRIILHHHERWDGRGYPLGLRGPQISQGARAFAIADTIDAITQDRPYRRGRSLDEAREEILRHRGTQFDPDAVDAFLSLREADLINVAAIRARVALDLLVGNSSVQRAPVAAGVPAPA